MLFRSLPRSLGFRFGEFDRKRKREQNLKRTIGRLMNNKMSRAWGSWAGLVGTKKRKGLRLQKGLKFWENQTLTKAWNAWLDLHERARKYKKIFKHWKNRQLAKVDALCFRLAKCCRGGAGD